MKPKTLLVLVLILAILGGIAYLRQAQRAEVSIVDEVELHTLAADDVDADTIDRLVVYTGERSEKKVVLTRSEGSEAWRVDSYYNAPANITKIEPFMNQLLEVQGEFRVTAPKPELKTYGLSEDTGFQIEAYSGDDKRIHVLVGKSANPSTVFMRRADSRDVFVTNATLKEDAGLFGDTSGMAASPDWWLDKNILSLDTDPVTEIDLTYPDKRLRFERVALEAEETGKAPVEEQDAADETGAETDATGDEPEYEWKLVEGGLDRPFKPEAVEAILSKLGSLSAVTIVNPEKKDEYALDPPNHVAAFTMEDGQELVIHGGRPAPRKGTYMTLPGSGEDIVYNVSRWDFHDVFPLGEDLYNLSAETFNAEDVTRLSLRTGDAEVVVEKTEDAWRLVSPNLTLTADQYKPRDVASAAANGLAVKDFTSSDQRLGLDPPLATAAFTLTDGSEYVVQRGIAHTSVDGHYARLPGLDFPVAVENLELDKVFAGLAGLVDRTLLSGVPDTSIVAIDVDAGETAFSLRDNEMFWTVTAGDERFNADFDTLEDYRYALTVLEATDLQRDSDYTPSEDAQSITMTRDDGSVITLTFESSADDDGSYTVTASNHPGLVFTVTGTAAGRALVGPDHFRPEPVEEDAGAPSDTAETP